MRLAVTALLSLCPFLSPPVHAGNSCFEQFTTPVLDLAHSTVYKATQSADIAAYRTNSLDFGTNSDSAPFHADVYSNLSITNIHLKWPGQTDTYVLAFFPNGNAVALGTEILAEASEGRLSAGDFAHLSSHFPQENSEGYYPSLGVLRDGGGLRLIRPILAGRYLDSPMSNGILRAGDELVPNTLATSVIEWEMRQSEPKTDQGTLSFLPMDYLKNPDADIKSKVDMGVWFSFLNQYSQIFLTQDRRLYIDGTSLSTAPNYDQINKAGLVATYDLKSSGTWFRYDNWLRLNLVSRMNSVEEIEQYFEWLKENRKDRYGDIFVLAMTIDMQGGGVPLWIQNHLNYKIAQIQAHPLIFSKVQPYQVPPNLNFPSSELRAYHFNKHGKEFGTQNEAQYVAYARGALAGRHGVFSYYTRPNGDTVFMAPDASWFAVVNAGGVLTTFFKPNPRANKLLFQNNYMIRELLRSWLQ